MNCEAAQLADNTRGSSLCLCRSRRWLFVAMLAAGVANLLPAQSLTVSLAGPPMGNTVLLNLVLSTPSGVEQPAAIEWAFSYSSDAITSFSVIAGPALTASQKSLFCNGNATNYICLAAGLNALTISDGLVATVSVTLASGFTTALISMGNPSSSDSSGNFLLLSTPGSFNVETNSVLSVVCSPALSFAVTEGGTAPAPQTCTVTTTPSGLNVSLTVSSVGGDWLSATLSRPTSPAMLTVWANPNGLPAGAYSGAICISVPGVASTSVPVIPR
jgi:hypothetical protein